MALEPPTIHRYSLPAKTALEQVDANTIALVINRKSRIILADGRKILEKANRIKGVTPSTTVILKTTAPVCGKTKSFLEDAGVQVLIV